MADNQSPAALLHALLDPSTTEGQQYVNDEESGTLKRLSATYKDALKNQNVGQLTETIGSITRELNKAGLFVPDAERVLRTYDFRPYETRPTTSVNEAPALEIPIQWLPKRGEEGGGGGGVGDKDLSPEEAKNLLRENQKKAVLDEFKNLLDEYKDSPDRLPGAVDDFYRKHLSAAGVIGKQYDVLLNQTRKLYGKNDEFDKHKDVLEKEASESVEKLQAIHQIGPLQDPKDQEQREVELNHLKILRSHGVNRDALVKSVSNMFDEQWDGRQVGKIVDQFAHELASMDFSYGEVVQGVTSVMTTTTVQTPIEEEEPQPIPQGGQGGRRGGKGLGRKAAGEAKSLVESGAKKVGKEVAKGVIEKGTQAIAAEGAEEAAAGLAGTIEIWGPPVGIGCLVIIVIIVIIAAAAFIYFNFFKGGAQVAPGVSTIIAQNAKIISDNLCKTTIVPGSTVSQRCNGSRGDLYDNINPGAAYPQPHARFPIFDWSLQNSHFGIQFTKPDKGTYWAYNRPFCTGNCLPWDYRGWGRYWCTDLVMDAYAASGFTAIVDWSDPDPGYTHNWGTGNTSVMIKFFMRNSGYSFIPANQFDASKIASGSAIFFKWDNNPRFLGEHTGIVSGIQPDINHRGFGTINTLEANAWNLTGHYTYRNNNPGNQIVGFGIKTGK